MIDDAFFIIDTTQKKSIQLLQIKLKLINFVYDRATLENRYTGNYLTTKTK